MLTLLLACLVMNAAAFLMPSVTSEGPLVNAPWGQISGRNVTSPGGLTYSSFLAIPYALPPLGERRFAKPEVHPGPGEGQVFQTPFMARPCPQLTPEAKPFMTEDCLTLDVHVPLAANGSHSVIIYIHGGRFNIGSSAVFVPSELVTENDVIVVVIQYRLGVLGFLASGDAASPGNYGLHDQHLAIQWVKDNIRAFGGDPDSITLYGQSAGSVSVGMQLLSPYPKAFSRVVLQSGFPSSAWAINEVPELSFKELAEASGCGLGNTNCSDPGNATNEEIVACLRKVDSYKLLLLSVLRIDNLSTSEVYAWTPVVDGDFIPRDPLKLLADADYLATNDVINRDVMLAVNSEEGKFLFNVISDTKSAYIVANYSEADLKELATLFTIRPEMARFIFAEEVKYRFSEALVSADHCEGAQLNAAVNVMDYFYNKPLVSGNITIKDVTDAFADINLIVPMMSMARSLARASAEKGAGGAVYIFENSLHPARRANLTRFRGMPHAEEIRYVFDVNVLIPSIFSREGFTADDHAFSVHLRSILADFAKTGNVSQSVVLEDGGSWPEYSLEDEQYLSLGNRPRVGDHPYGKRMAFWLDLLPSLLGSDGTC